MRIKPEHIGEKQKYLVYELSKHGWRWPKTRDGKKYNKFTKVIDTSYDRSTWSAIIQLIN